MEISPPLKWYVQEFVANYDGKNFMNRDVAEAIGSRPSSVDHILEKMECVKMAHKSNRQVLGDSDRNIYVSTPPGKSCKKCYYEQSNTSGCVILRKDLRKFLVRHRFEQAQGVFGIRVDINEEVE